MRNITTNKKLTAEERLNLISGFQVQFNKLMKETELLSGSIQPQVACEELPAAQPVQPKVIANNGIKTEIEPEEEEQDKQYEDVLETTISQIRRALCHLRWQELFDEMYLVYTSKKRTDSLKISRITQISLQEIKTGKL